MKLNDEMIQSVFLELNKYCDKELSDDYLNQVSGGRQMYDSEIRSAYDVLKSANMDYVNGKMSYEQYADFVEAVNNYEKYIASLPECSETVLFNYNAKGVYVLPPEGFVMSGGVIGD